METVTLKKKVEAKIRANARRGARALDKVSSTWYKSQNLSLRRLKMESSCDCVWGQLDMGSHAENAAFQEAFHSPMNLIPGYVPQYNGSDNEKCFVSDEAQYKSPVYTNPEEMRLTQATQDAEWVVLEDEWKKQIQLRRRAARAS